MPSERPILRFPEPRLADRITGGPRNPPQPRGPGRGRQGARLGARFAALEAAVRNAQGAVELAEDPTGVAPERALVFETAGSIQNFARAARRVGLEVIAEVELEDTDDIPEGFELPEGQTAMAQTLYATMPTLQSAEQFLRLWRAYQADQPAPHGFGPWWRLFDQLLTLRAWGPDDRLPTSARDAILEQIGDKADDDAVKIELEIWPSAFDADRAPWRQEAEAKALELGGEIVDRSSISGTGFVYEALLVSMPAQSVRQLLRDPFTPGGLGMVKGIQFILPQTVAQALPDPDADAEDDPPGFAAFSQQAPLRAALLDGTPVAAHPALDGGVVIEDLHDVVRRSVVSQRLHATAMASLILRGDLAVDRAPAPGARLLCVPLMIDIDRGGVSPNNRLIVDMVHVTLTRLFIGANALAPDVFVVNLSLGMSGVRFAGRISALARLLDWWAHEHGILFVVSAGNIKDELVLQNVQADRFLGAEFSDRLRAVRQSLQQAAYARSLTLPAEALNVLTVGAISEDRTPPYAEAQAAGVVRLTANGERFPAICSALGLGPFRSIKPDLLESGGMQELRAIANGEHTKLSFAPHPRTGLVVASPRQDAPRGVRRSYGPSCAAALTTRAVLQSAAALTDAGGAFDGQALPRQDLALMTRALAVNAADWSGEALAHYADAHAQFGPHQSLRAKEDVSRHFGHGHLSLGRMTDSPAGGVTFVGLGTIQKDQGQIFDLPLPPSLSGQRVPRSMRVTLAWFSPMNGARARYRLASLQAIAADANEEGDEDKDGGWGLLLKTDGPHDHMIRRGTVWSRRLKHGRLAGPAYEEGQTIPIRVQCMDASGGGLSSQLRIRFAIAVTLEVEVEVEYDIHEETRTQIEQRLRGGA